MKPTYAKFNSSRKHPFSTEKLITFNIAERCISSEILTMSALIFPPS